MVCDLRLSADRTVAHAGIGGHAVGASHRGQCAAQALESCGTGQGERPPRLCAIEQRLSSAGTLWVVSSTLDASGTPGQLKRLHSKKGRPSVHPEEVSSEIEEKEGFCSARKQIWRGAISKSKIPRRE